MEEFINSLHNTIDYNKEQIIQLMKKSGNTNLKLIFEVNPLELVTFKIECEKLASKKFFTLEPFTFGDLLQNEVEQTQQREN